MGRSGIHLPAKNVEAIRTVLSVPISKGDEVLGVLSIYHLEGIRPFTDKQIALVETFADQAAIAIDNVRLLDELRQRTRELGRSVEELRARACNLFELRDLGAQAKPVLMIFEDVGVLLIITYRPEFEPASRVVGSTQCMR